VRVTLGVMVVEAVWQAEAVGVREVLAEPPCGGVPLCEGVAVALALGELECVGERVGLGVALPPLGESVGVGEPPPGPPGVSVGAAPLGVAAARGEAEAR
jgi:hypothetical protein